MAKRGRRNKSWYKKVPWVKVAIAIVVIATLIGGFLGVQHLVNPPIPVVFTEAATEFFSEHEQAEITHALVRYDRRFGCEFNPLTIDVIEDIVFDNSDLTETHNVDATANDGIITFARDSELINYPFIAAHEATHACKSGDTTLSTARQIYLADGNIILGYTGASVIVLRADGTMTQFGFCEEAIAELAVRSLFPNQVGNQAYNGLVNFFVNYDINRMLRFQRESDFTGLADYILADINTSRLPLVSSDEQQLINVCQLAFEGRIR